MSTSHEDTNTVLSRKSRRKSGRGERLGEREESPPSDELPSRRTKYPSNKAQTARWFYNTLIVLFLLLMAGLFWYGRELSQG